MVIVIRLFKAGTETMLVQPFRRTYQRKRIGRKRRTDFATQGINETSRAVEETSSQEQKNVKKHSDCSKRTPLPNSPLPSSSVPRGRRSKARKQMPDPVTGVIPAEGKDCPCPATSTPHPRSISRRKLRKRKTELKDDSSDSEINFIQQIRVRGHVRRGRKSTNTTTYERGKLDSATLHHYLMHIWSAFPAEKVKSVAYFDPLWFNLYANQDSRAMVLNWIKEKDMFSKIYVMVPIVLWSHWSLLIFCHLGGSPHSRTNAPCMILLDSLHAIGPNRLEPLIRRLLLDMYRIDGRLENKEQLKKVPLLIPKVPQQRRGEECGYYVLYYINLFLESAPENFSISEGYPYFMKKDWFTADGVESFYKRLDTFPKVVGYDDDIDDYASGSVDSSGVIHVE